MTENTITLADLHRWQLIADAAQLKAPSPWYRETDVTDGGTVASNILFDANGKLWADSLNSDMAMNCEDFDESGVHLYDCGTLEVFEHMQTFDPETVTRLLAAYAAEHDSSGAWASRAAASGLQVEACVGLLTRAAAHIRWLHSCIEDEVSTDEAIALDPLLAEMGAVVAGWGKVNANEKP